MLRSVNIVTIAAQMLIGGNAFDAHAGKLVGIKVGRAQCRSVFGTHDVLKKIDDKASGSLHVSGSRTYYDIEQKGKGSLG